MPITQGNQLFLGTVQAMNQRASLGIQARGQQQQFQIAQQQLAQGILKLKQAQEAQDAMNKFRMESMKMQQENFRLKEEQWQATDQLRQVQLQQEQVKLQTMTQQFERAQQLPTVLADVMGGIGGIAQAQVAGDEEAVQQAITGLTAMFEKPEVAALTEQILPFATRAYSAFNISPQNQAQLMQAKISAAKAARATMPEDISGDELKALDTSFEQLREAFGTIKTRDGVFSSPEEVDRVYEDKSKKILDEFKPTSQTIMLLSQMGYFKEDEILKLLGAAEKNDSVSAGTVVSNMVAGLQKAKEEEANSEEKRRELEAMALRLAGTQEELARINRTHTATRKLVESVGADLYRNMRGNYSRARAEQAYNPVERASFETEAAMRETMEPLQELMSSDEVQRSFNDYINTAAPTQEHVAKLWQDIERFAPVSIRGNLDIIPKLQRLLARAHASQPTKIQ